MMFRSKFSACIVLLFFISCGNKELVRRNSIHEFQQLHSIQSFDSVVVNYGLLDDSASLKIVFDFNTIGDAINSAISTKEKMIWKGSFFATLNNGISLEISCYGAFFSEVGTGKVFIIPEPYSKKFSQFVKDILNNSKSSN